MNINNLKVSRTDKGLQIGNSLLVQEGYVAPIFYKNDTSLREVLLVLVELGETYNANRYLSSLIWDGTRESERFFHFVSGGRYVINPWERNALVSHINNKFY